MKQKYIKPTGMVAFIAYMQMFVPLSIDLYLPALPKMAGSVKILSQIHFIRQ